MKFVMYIKSILAILLSLIFSTLVLAEINNDNHGQDHDYHSGNHNSGEHHGAFVCQKSADWQETYVKFSCSGLPEDLCRQSLESVEVVDGLSIDDCHYVADGSDDQYEDIDHSKYTHFNVGGEHIVREISFSELSADLQNLYHNSDGNRVFNDIQFIAGGSVNNQTFQEISVYDNAVSKEHSDHKKESSFDSNIIFALVAALGGGAGGFGGIGADRFQNVYTDHGHHQHTSTPSYSSSQYSGNKTSSSQSSTSKKKVKITDKCKSTPSQECLNLLRQARETEKKKLAELKKQIPEGKDAVIDDDLAQGMMAIEENLYSIDNTIKIVYGEKQYNKEKALEATVFDPNTTNKVDNTNKGTAEEYPGEK